LYGELSSTMQLKMDYIFAIELSAEEETNISIRIGEETYVTAKAVSETPQVIWWEAKGLPHINRKGNVSVDIIVDVVDDTNVLGTMLGYITKQPFQKSYRFMSLAPEHNIYQKVEGRLPGTNAACGVDATEDDFASLDTYHQYNNKYGRVPRTIVNTATFNVILDTDSIRG